MMKKPIIIISCVVGVVLVYILGYGVSGLNYIAGKAGMRLPKNIKDADAYLADRYAVAHGTLPLDSLDTFIQRNGFVKCLDAKYAVLPQETGFLNKKYRSLKNNAQVYRHSAKDNCAGWEAVLDKTSGDLWLVLFPSDKSGDCSN